MFHLFLVFILLLIDLSFTQEEHPTVEYGWTPLHLAIANKRIEEAESLVLRAKQVGDNLDSADFNGQTALHMAVVLNDLKNVTRLLIQNGANVNVKNKLGLTPLHNAVRWDNVAAVDQLLQAGATVDARKTIPPSDENQNSEYDTPLHLAVFLASPEMVSLLLRYNASVELRDPRGRTSLHRTMDSPANASVKLQIVRALVEQGGANVSAKFHSAEDFSLNKPEIQTGTALYEAALWGYQEIVEFLISKGAPVNEQNSYGLTPLYVAVSNKNVAMVKMLLDAGADPKICCPASESWAAGQNILHQAVDIVKSENNLEIVKMLLAHGANDPKLIGAKDKHGHTPAQVARKEGYLEVAQLLENANDQIKREQ